MSYLKHTAAQNCVLKRSYKKLEDSFSSHDEDTK